MLSNKSELVWQGRTHLGDEPGVFSDAAYSGLAMELPITLQKNNSNGSDTAKLALVTQNAETFAGYPGHLITVTLHQPDAGMPENHFTETVLTTARLKGSDDDYKEFTVDLANQPSPAFLSIRVRIDTEVPLGCTTTSL